MHDVLCRGGCTVRRLKREAEERRKIEKEVRDRRDREYQQQMKDEEEAMKRRQAARDEEAREAREEQRRAYCPSPPC